MESYFFWTKEKNQKISFFFEGIEGEFKKKYPSENRRRRKFLQLIAGSPFREEEEFFLENLLLFFEILLYENRRRRRKSSQLIAGKPFTDEEEIFFGEPTPSEKNKKIIYFFSQEGK